MCGWIAALNEDVSSRMRLIAHRGVRQRVVKTEWGSVGHVRLPIVGLDEEFDQPVQVEDGLLAFVGEILDFKERAPDSECDLGTVVKAWEVAGPRGFTDFDGFWSVAVLMKNSLHLLCDYLAQKPTYYRIDRPIAASEIDALAMWSPVTPNELYFSSVMKWGYCPDARQTPYQEIYRVLPGEHVVMTHVQPPLRQIVDPLLPVTIHAPDVLKIEIDSAVRRRVLSSDVPVAVLLSGGLDSSIVYTLARRYGTVKAYYAADSDDEDLVEKLAVSAMVGNDPVEKIWWNDVPMVRALRYMQEPIDLGSLIPQVALSDQIKERVCLTGDGADELFGGYGRAQRYDSQASDVWHELVAWHLPRLDRTMMRNCIEVRSPFLAREVAGIALGLPWELRKGKKILRDLFRDDLPACVVDGPKKPLRTRAVETDREANSLILTEAFRRIAFRRGT